MTCQDCAAGYALVCMIQHMDVLSFDTCGMQITLERVILGWVDISDLHCVCVVHCRKFSLSAGASTCTDCLAGTFSTAMGASSKATCDECLAGKFSAENGTTQCEDCVAGKHSTLFGSSSNSSCTDCDAGKFAAASATTCTQCAATGKTTPAAGATSVADCTLCVAGKFASPGRQRQGTIGCNPCSAPPGNFCPSGSFSSNGTICTAGHFCAGGTSLPQICPAGSGWVGDSSQCLEDVSQPLLLWNYIGSESDCMCNPGFYSQSGRNLNTSEQTNFYEAMKLIADRLLKDAGEGKTLTRDDEPVLLGVSDMQFNVASTGEFDIQNYEHILPGSDSDEDASNQQSLSSLYNCIACPAGKMSVGASTSCKDCAAGSYSMQAASLCSSCIPGTYSGTGAMSCTPCEEGKFSNVSGASSISSCRNCPAGTFSVIAGAPNSSVCTHCPDGKFSTSGATACDPCLAGKFAASHVACPFGSKYDDDNCACETSALTGTNTISQGFPTYSNNANCSWLISAAGSVLLSFSSFATEQDHDYVTINSCESPSCSVSRQLARLSGSLVSSSTVFTASAGYMQVLFTSDAEISTGGFIAVWETHGASMCLDCPAGKTSDDALTCATCAEGQYSRAGGECVPCLAEPGAYCPAGSSSEAGIPCPENHYCLGGTSSPQSCPRSTVCASGASEVGDCGCSPGFWHNPLVTVECSGSCPCAPVSIAVDDGQEASGTISDGSSYYSNNENCYWVISANWQADITLEVTYLNTQSCCDKLYIKECSSSTGPTSCVGAQDLATFSGSSRGTRTSSTGILYAYFRSDHSHTNRGFDARWSVSAPGRAVTSAACTLCPSGKYSVGGFSRGCLDCPVGKYAQAVGTCTSCVPGKYGWRGNAMDPICLPCAKGFFSDPGSTVCFSCDPGKYRDVETDCRCSYDDEQHCQNCPAGTSAPPRKYAVGNGTHCAICPAGKFASAAGAGSECAPVCADCLCDAGFYTPHLDASTWDAGTCLACPPGQYSATGGSTACRLCSAGTFSDSFNSTACTNCSAPAGHYCPQQSPLASGLICPLGYSCPGGAQDKLRCPSATGVGWSYCPEPLAITAIQSSASGGIFAAEVCPKTPVQSFGELQYRRCELRWSWTDLYAGHENKSIVFKTGTVDEWTVYLYVSESVVQHAYSVCFLLNLLKQRIR